MMMLTLATIAAHPAMAPSRCAGHGDAAGDRGVLPVQHLGRGGGEGDVEEDPGEGQRVDADGGEDDPGHVLVVVEQRPRRHPEGGGEQQGDARAARTGKTASERSERRTPQLVLVSSQPRLHPAHQAIVTSSER